MGCGYITSTTSILYIFFVFGRTHKTTSAELVFVYIQHAIRYVRALFDYAFRWWCYCRLPLSLAAASQL